MYPNVVDLIPLVKALSSSICLLAAICVAAVVAVLVNLYVLK